MTHEGRALDSTDIFADRHIGPRRADIDRMLSTLGVESLDALIAQAVPDAIRTQTPLKIGRGLSRARCWLGRGDWPARTG